MKEQAETLSSDELTPIFGLPSTTSKCGEVALVSYAQHRFGRMR